jgi:hypothetical protein
VRKQWAGQRKAQCRTHRRQIRACNFETESLSGRAPPSLCLDARHQTLKVVPPEQNCRLATCLDESYFFGGGCLFVVTRRWSFFLKGHEGGVGGLIGPQYVRWANGPLKGDISSFILFPFLFYFKKFILLHKSIKHLGTLRSA